MSKYSEFFLLTSAEYETIGDKLRLRKYGSWLAEEAWLREKQNQKRAQFTLRTIQLARRIAKEKGMPEDEVFQLLQADSTERAELFAEFSEETSKLMELIPSGREQFEELVTLFFRNRGEVNIGKKWQGTDDWTKEDTNKLPEVLLQRIEAFMAAEEGESEETEAGEEEDEKKAL
jgi:hypothetical protein